MATLLPWQAAITASDVERDNLGAPYSGSSQEDTDSSINQAILDIQGMVETYLRRPLIVREFHEIVPSSHYKYTLGYEKWEVILKNDPVVEIVSASTPSSPELKNAFDLDEDTYAGYKVLSESFHVGLRVSYFAGWRRHEDTTLSELRNYTDKHAQLHNLPPVLPMDIRSVITEMVLHRLNLARNQQFGIGQKVQSVAGASLRFDAPEGGFYTRRLRLLKPYMRLWG